MNSGLLRKRRLTNSGSVRYWNNTDDPTAFRVFSDFRLGVIYWFVHRFVGYAVALLVEALRDFTYTSAAFFKKKIVII